MIGPGGNRILHWTGHVGIHSPHKKEVGRRLGLKVLSTAFNQNVAEDGPTVVSACVKTPPTVVGGTNVTAITVELGNANNLSFVPTDECSAQSPICCNGTQVRPCVSLLLWQYVRCGPPN